MTEQDWGSFIPEGADTDSSGTFIPEKPAKAAASRPMSNAAALGISARAQHPAFQLLSFIANNLQYPGAMAGEALGAAGGVGLGAMTGPAAPFAIPTLGYSGGVAGGGAGGAAGRAATNALSMTPAGEFLGLERAPSVGQGVGNAALANAGASAVGLPIANVVGRAAGVVTGKTLARASANAEGIARASQYRAPVADLTDALRPLQQEAADMGTREAAAVKRMTDSFTGSKSIDVSAHELHRIRQTADNVAKRIHDLRDAKQPVGPALAMKGRFWELIGNRARDMLKSNVSGYKEAMPAVRSAARDMNMVPRVSDTGPIRPKLTNLGGLTDMAARRLAGPSAIDFYGSGLDSQLLQWLLGQSPRAAVPFVEPQEPAARAAQEGR